MDKVTPAHEISVEERYSGATVDLADTVETLTPGGSLRDEFAMAALSGLLASFGGSYTDSPSPQVQASRAYRFADAMMRARTAV